MTLLILGSEDYMLTCELQPHKKNVNVMRTGNLAEAAGITHPQRRPCRLAKSEVNLNKIWKEAKFNVAKLNISKKNKVCWMLQYVANVANTSQRLLARFGAASIVPKVKMQQNSKFVQCCKILQMLQTGRQRSPRQF